MTFLTLLGCYDFQGDEGALWFTSNLVLDHATAWTPDSGVAGGTAPTLAATAFVGDEDADEGPVVWGWSSRGEVPDEANILNLDPIQRGTTRVEFDGDAFDRFDVRFRPADSLVVVDGAGQPVRDVVVVPDQQVELRLRVVDRWGRPLGWQPGSLQAEADGDASAWPVDGAVFVEASDDAGVFVTAAGVESFLSLGVAPVAWTEVRPVAEIDGHCVVQHMAWAADGRRVLGSAEVFGDGFEAIGGALAVSDERGHPGCE